MSSISCDCNEVRTVNYPDRPKTIILLPELVEGFTYNPFDSSLALLAQGIKHIA